MKNKIRCFLNNHIVEKSILIIIVLNLFVFILDTISSFHSAFSSYIKLFELISIIIFTIEYILRLFTLNSFKGLFQPMMIIDFWAIFPYYLSFCPINTVLIRTFRLLRIIRIFKIGRYSKALDSIINIFKTKREELIIALSIFCIGILVSSILLYFAENDAQPDIFSSIPKCFYFAIITFTSVGYGDIHPLTTIGKIICSISAILGVGLHGLFIGVIGSAFMQVIKHED